MLPVRSGRTFDENAARQLRSQLHPQRGVSVDNSLFTLSARSWQCGGQLVTTVVAPVAERLRAANQLRGDITAEDIASFLLMTIAADDTDQK